MWTKCGWDVANDGHASTGVWMMEKKGKGLGMERERERPERIDKTNRRIDEREIDGWSRENRLIIGRLRERN